MDKMKQEPYEEYLEGLSDEELVYIRNRVRWECERRIAEGNKKLMEAVKNDCKNWKNLEGDDMKWIKVC